MKIKKSTSLKKKEEEKNQFYNNFLLITKSFWFKTLGNQYTQLKNNNHKFRPLKIKMEFIAEYSQLFLLLI
jgi:hypothetical protein